MARRREIARAFKLAKKHLSLQYPYKGEEFICDAISNTNNIDHETSEEVAKAARDVIMKRIFPYHTAQCWLERRLGEKKVNEAGYEARQQWRMQWLDQLIVEFSK